LDGNLFDILSHAGSTTTGRDRTQHG